MNEIKVFMLGGKRCGKTTVLSSMCGAINKSLAGTELYLDVDPETQQELDKARASIIEHMKKFETPLTSCEVDDNPTSAEREYSFRLKRDAGGGKSKGEGIPFRIHDIPGEWLGESQQGAERVKALIHDCQVIIIAIDTPYLFAKMTDKGYGQYHEEYNKPLEITNFFKNTLSVDDLRDRMILFVPIKCERYYHLDRLPYLRDYGRRYMVEVTQAVAQGYRDLILYLRSNKELANNCTIAVTPILSAGGIDFINFRRDPETGKMVSYYQAPEYLPESELGYSPKFCEQPMVYMLSYLLSQVCDSRQAKNPLFQTGSTFMTGMSVEQMKNSMATLKEKMIRNSGVGAQDDGYLFIQNPKNL